MGNCRKAEKSGASVIVGGKVVGWVRLYIGPRVAVCVCWISSLLRFSQEVPYYLFADTCLEQPVDFLRARGEADFAGLQKNQNGFIGDAAFDQQQEIIEAHQLGASLGKSEHEPYKTDEYALHRSSPLWLSRMSNSRGTVVAKRRRWSRSNRESDWVAAPSAGVSLLANDATRSYNVRSTSPSCK